ncbi:LOW QUALITY PROTEIN: ras GTPase-activating-like protein IQGAP3 [Rhinatrema bivittatum]|uniref:LOW QUALITY PROTEIN: ras GTPase-activating-like protein IQGAP3 n=1 Tax=Rhinatrema bivittatum TaxID=194408 RepID=UPI0011260987|nr:LOW QUALITY PROTEIN: ras GTPase-activating-like protein IQGAP3 [Rhinatrema bivittatum]
MEAWGQSPAPPTGSGYERLTGDEMDAQRRQNVAYQYLCHLEEAKRWLEACLNEELPPPTELEESLRNGVTLAKMGHYFAPDVVPLRKIYDSEQLRYKAAGLHFRHTDNINHWRNAMAHVGLPPIFHPETTDIYDRKNMPRVVYCIHALSLYLFKLGLAPQIQDLYGKVNFTEEEINNMKSELEKYGLQMPAFSKIGGILANELSVDEAAVHAAVIAINEAVERGVVEETMMALQNPNAMLSNLRGTLAAVYQEILCQAKMQKAANARNRYVPDAPESQEIYDRCLTQAEIQGNINKVNVHEALEYVDDALERRDARALHSALQDPVLGLRRLQRENAECYLEQLIVDREQKALELGCVDLLEKEEIQAGVDAANETAKQEHAMEEAVVRINAAIRRGAAAKTAKELADPEAQLPDVYPFAAELYQRELAVLQLQKAEGELAQEELFVAVEMLSAVALINRALEAGDRNACWSHLISPATGLADIEDENAQRYFDKLLKLKHQSQKAGMPFLCWNQLQACVSDVNASIQEEHDKILAVRLINEALEQADPQKTLTALLMPAAGLADVALPVAQRYHHVLTCTRRHKAQVTKDSGAMLWLKEIHQGVLKANQDTETAKKMALGIAAINQAITEGNCSQTVRVLRNPDVSLLSVVTDCAAAYQSELARAMRAKTQTGDVKNLWVRHQLKDGGNYYFHLRTFEGTWDRPQGFAGNSSHLSREEMQAIITRVTGAYDRERQWEASAQLIVQLQARMRGYLARREFAQRSLILRKQLPAVLRIQACWRGYRQRKAYSERLWYLRRNTAAVIKLQSWLRMWRARQRYRERLRFFRKNIDSVIKIQAFVRANQARGDYRMLVHARNPPLSILRKFAHLLEQSEHDFWEELEVLKLREEVVKTIRSNQQLESGLNLMDIKIGLLVKNRITLQEVVSHCKKLTKKNKDQLSDLMVIDKQRGLKALSKEKRQKLEAYQHLFYLLQTQPVYLARLIFQMPQNKSTKFMESVIFTLYNYASNQREACLLLQLFRTALQEEIRLKVDRVQEVVTGNPTVIRMVVSFYRSARGLNALREILGDVVREVLQDKVLNIRTDPVDIYKGWINQMESQTGQRSKLPYNVSPEQALSHPEVQRRLDISIRHLITVADRFFTTIAASVDKIPYGMRYVAKVLKTSLSDKFPDAAEEDIDKIVGNLLYYRYMNPAVVAPDGFDIVDISAGGAVHPDHRRNLGSIAKVLQHVAAGKLFEGERAHLRLVNDYLAETHSKFRRFISAACSVSEPEDRFSIDEYSEMVNVIKPVIYITAGELINTHKLLLEHQDAISPSHGDPLHELLEDLGELPSIQSLIGEGTPGASDGTAEQAWTQLSKLELSLTLTNKLEMGEASNEEMDAKSLLLRTKQMLVDVIRSQPGDSLLQVLHASASAEQEMAHHRLMHQRAASLAQTPERMKRSRSLLGTSQLSMDEKKRKVIRNLRKLESLGVVTSADHYQDIINQIAKDIRNQRRYRQHRKAELVKLQQTLQGLNAKTVFYEEQIDYYDQYIKTCLDNLTANDRIASKNKKRPSLSYTAARLFEKGVLLEIEDLPVSQFRNVIFDILPCTEAGKFQVKARFLGVDMEKFQLHYQDLLQLQYEGVAVMKMFDKAKVNVNLLIFLLNKKMFKK